MENVSPPAHLVGNDGWEAAGKPSASIPPTVDAIVAGSDVS
jgi:hypothetical protein